jgi:transcriptional regulator with XRE-family HTH domain
MAPDCRTPNSVDRHVGKRVRAGRILRSMGQERLAELLGLTHQQIQKYEKGTNRIVASRLLAIAKILELPVEYFYDGAPDGADGAGASDGGGERELLQTVLAVRSPENRRLLLDMARVMADREPAAKGQAPDLAPARTASRAR